MLIDIKIKTFSYWWQSDDIRVACSHDRNHLPIISLSLGMVFSSFFSSILLIIGSFCSIFFSNILDIIHFSTISIFIILFSIHI